MKNQAKVKRELLSRINQEDSIQVEKVERYLNLLELYYKLDEAIEEFGTMITTVNGSQKFTKPNPAIAEKNKMALPVWHLDETYIKGFCCKV
ncbi:P27 family phage terminase small subunit [Bacillus cereus group sp. N6]|uniref:P27 family phage terminase small subunit n=1 Tax=Bacillus cereus group sp. N6 TaxID=2794583 RepID=UPI0018F6BD71|nr:P27 family phage terminase small subunit [Bacillus cereus group sp. N6]